MAEPRIRPMVPQPNRRQPPDSTPRRGGFGAKARTAFAAAWRLGAIALTVRSQRIATRRVAPMADLVHAMAYMGIPVGLDLGRRDLAPVVYDARDIYVHARNIARLPLPARRLFGAVERRWARAAARVMTVNRPLCGGHGEELRDAAPGDRHELLVPPGAAARSGRGAFTRRSPSSRPPGSCSTRAASLRTAGSRS